MTINTTDNSIIAAVPTFKFSALQNYVNKLNRKAVKLNMPILNLTATGETYNVEVRNENGHTFSVEMTKFKISGVPFCIEDHILIAKLDRVEGGNIVNTVPGIGFEVPEEFRTNDFHCDHCHHNRMRNNVYVIYNSKEEKFLQVGSTCMNDYFGKNVNQIINMYDRITIIGNTLEDDEFSGFGGCPQLYPVKDVLSVAFAAARTFGYVKSSEMGSTKEEVQRYFGSVRRDTAVKQPDAEAQDVEKADAALAWLDEQTDDNDFIYNVKTIISSGNVSIRHFGYIVGIVPFFNNSLAKKAEAGRNSDSEYVGTIKKRQDFTLTLETIKAIDGYYGATYIHNFVDENDNVIVWFASNNDADLKEGETYKVKATPKAHKEFNGIKQTTVQRVKVL